MRYVTVAELSDMIRQNLWKIPHDIDCVVGIPRSGMLPASLIALYLNTNLGDVESFLNGRCFEIGHSRPHMMRHNTIKKVLIVDDSVGAGGSMTQTKEKLKKIAQEYDFTFLAPIVTSVGKEYVDVFFEVIDDQRIFEWNLFHHGFLENSCIDIDGVLCKDPYIDDDGEQYVHFLQTATPLYIPTAPIGTIISCRLEKYRKLTETWLEKYHIEYKELVMLDLPNKSARVKWGKHGEYKGEFYKSSEHNLFIESSLNQAEIIASISHKPVICIESNSMVIDSPIRVPKKELSNSISKIFVKIHKVLEKTRESIPIF